MANTEAGAHRDVDLTTCDQEPIHIPGSIQPHGALLVLTEPALTVRHASANVLDVFGTQVEEILGRSLEELLGPDQGPALKAALDAAPLERNPRYLSTIQLAPAAVERSFTVVAHRHAGALIVEFEATDPSVGPNYFWNFHPVIREFVARLERTGSVREISQLATTEIRRITGFDRVLAYRFNDDESGTVVAEDCDPDLPSYLDLRFPASDIPRQARELYVRNRLRLIADADYRPVPIVPQLDPETGRPIDLSFATLRSVSPIHVEYLKNMGVAASMSVSILRGGRLWGLISCHHRTPRVIPVEVRAACELMGQVFSLQLAAKEGTNEIQHRVELKTLQAELLTAMADTDGFLDGLASHPERLIGLVDAEGAAILHDGRCILKGRTPDEAQVRRLADWLSTSVRDEVFASDSLASEESVPELDGAAACGVLAVSISKVHRSYILWFRPELVRTVHWAGDPRKPALSQNDGEPSRLHPRRSFELWKETVRQKARTWRPSEIETAADFRNAIVGIVLRKAEELAELNAELERSNKELEAFSYSVSHDLRAPFRHIVGYSELLKEKAGDQIDPQMSRYLEIIIDSAHYAGTLVDNLLSFSQMGRATLASARVDLNALARDVQTHVMREADDRRVVWHFGELPIVTGDAEMLRLVFYNLFSNAVKYTRGRTESRIVVSSVENDREYILSVQDNGVGFDMRYVDKLFGVFQRLHRMEEFEGTGIGLANVRRIIARHGGRTWAEGEVDRGATVFFTLPKP